jgi:FtsH-binding integral membrane protein
MSNWQSSNWQGQIQSPGYDLADRSAAAQGFITRVYGWMSAGLALTAFIAYLTASSPAMIQFIFANRGVFWGLFIVELLIVVGLSGFINKISPAAAAGGFLLYAALNGLLLAAIFLVYTQQSLAVAFFVTAGTFGATALYGAATKRDLTSLGSFMFMGLIGLIIASVVNIFLHSQMVYWISSFFGVFIFVGLTAYDSQKIKNLSYSSNIGDVAVAQRASIVGALALYLDFINLFLFILRLMGSRRD